MKNAERRSLSNANSKKMNQTQIYIHIYIRMYRTCSNLTSSTFKTQVTRIMDNQQFSLSFWYIPVKTCFARIKILDDCSVMEFKQN